MVHLLNDQQPEERWNVGVNAQRVGNYAAPLADSGICVPLCDRRFAAPPQAAPQAVISFAGLPGDMRHPPSLSAGATPGGSQEGDIIGIPVGPGTVAR
jgi:hypothetical protein